MAERIKYQYINSVKQGTEEQSEPNSTSSPGQPEPNSNKCVLTQVHSENFIEGDNCFKSLIDLPLLAESDKKESTPFDYIDNDAENDSETNPRSKIIGGTDSPSGGDSSSSDKEKDDTSEDSESEKSQDEHTTNNNTEQSTEWETTSSAGTRESGPLPPVSHLNEPVEKETSSDELASYDSVSDIMSDDSLTETEAKQLKLKAERRSDISKR